MIDAVYCTNCRNALSRTDMFCKHCGADLRVPPQQQKPVATPYSVTRIAPPTKPTLLSATRQSSGVANPKKVVSLTCIGCLGFALFLFVIGSIVGKPSHTNSSSSLNQTTEEQARIVEVGMSKQQVINLLGGTAMASETMNPDYIPGQGQSALMYELPDDGIVAISFNNDKVTSVWASRSKQTIFEKGDLPPN